MVYSTSRFVEDISNSMFATRNFNDRWLVVNETLRELGSAAINATAIDAESENPHWFRSNLGADILGSYVSEGHCQHDVIVQHAARDGSKLVWHPENGWNKATEPGQAAFADFVVDCGYRSIVSTTRIGRSTSDVRNLTFCSTLVPKEVLDPENLRRIQLAMNIVLPWIGWPEHQGGTEYVRARKVALSPREAEALSYLAGGFLYARIADTMGISEAMVAKHLFSARRKLSARTREQAIALAIRDNHIHP